MWNKLLREYLFQSILIKQSAVYISSDYDINGWQTRWGLKSRPEQTKFLYKLELPKNSLNKYEGTKSQVILKLN